MNFSKTSPSRQDPSHKTEKNILPLIQAEGSYRYGEEALELAKYAASLLPQKAATVAELGCGCGASLFYLADLRNDLFCVGFENQNEHIGYARRNSRYLGLETRTRFIQCELGHNSGGAFFSESFDAVIANPPFYTPIEGRPSKNDLRNSALRSSRALPIFCENASRLLSHHGFFFLVYPAAKAQSLFALLRTYRLGLRGAKLVIRPHSEASRIYITARKNAAERCVWTC
ncbi:MAG: methyltransferase domain-containing protein [Desulfovibrio sp.]|nr:methyltransferase domain-containing protein [Desulfovibrio sp.]